MQCILQAQKTHERNEEKKDCEWLENNSMVSYSWAPSVKGAVPVHYGRAGGLERWLKSNGDKVSPCFKPFLIRKYVRQVLA